MPMLNKKPIFIVGLGRGGSSILLNILRSHPDVCSPRGETQQVFHGKPEEKFCVRLGKLLRYAPVVMAQRQDVFSVRQLKLRRKLSAFSERVIDRVLFEDKCRAMGATQNLFKAEGIKYTNEEIRQSRLLSKNLNGLVFLTNTFAKMYPDATFIGLIRNGFAICESYIRRWGKPASYVGSLYQAVSERMIMDAAKHENFHLLKYEDLVSNTDRTCDAIFDLADLDGRKVEKFRLVVNVGRHSKGRTGGDAKRLRWYSRQEFSEVITPKVNLEQIEKMTEKDKTSFLAYARPSMEHFGYL